MEQALGVHQVAITCACVGHDLSVDKLASLELLHALKDVMTALCTALPRVSRWRAAHCVLHAIMTYMRAVRLAAVLRGDDAAAEEQRCRTEDARLWLEFLLGVGQTSGTI